ncbi:MAG: major capsid protein [Lachnospiraceae bacterium]|nr:major capsid protein [Lachnospiraceae bacterium]
MAQYGYLKNFNSLMEMAGLLSNEQFSVFLEDVVFPYRTGNGRNTDGFKQLPLKPAFNMTYAALQRENNIGVMANHVALEAHARPTPTRGFSALEGTIPHMATNETMGQEDYLRAAKLLMEAEMVGTPLVTAARLMLQENFDAKLREHDDRASYMRDYVVFNGKYEITKDNNDGSYSNIEFDFKVPTENRKTLTGNSRWWTDEKYEVEGSESNPIRAIDETLLSMMAKGMKKSNIEIEIGFYTLYRLVNHTKVRADIALFLNSMLVDKSVEERVNTTAGMSHEELVSALERRIGVKFVVRDFITSIPVINPKTGKFEFKDMTGFKEDVLVFKPKGNIGEIHSSGHLTVGGDAGSVGSYGMYDGGRILMTYNCNTREKVQIWDTEETSLYVLTAGKNMRYLTVK